jgi:hypothetical protein
VAHPCCLGLKEEPGEDDVWYCGHCKCHGCAQPCTAGKRIDLAANSLSVPARTAQLTPGPSRLNPLLWPKGGRPAACPALPCPALPCPALPAVAER